MIDIIEFLKTPMGAGLAGIALLAIGFNWIRLNLSKQARGLFKLFGAIALAFAVVVGFNIPITFLSPSQPASTLGDFDVVGSDAHSYIAIDQESQSFTWTTGYNHTSEAIVGATQATFSFSINRGLGTVGTVQTSATVTHIPEVSNSTSGVSASLISKSGSQYNAIWTGPTTTGIETITVTIAEASDGIVLSLNMTLNQGAIKNMATYAVQTISLDVAGQPWTIGVLVTGGT